MLFVHALHTMDRHALHTMCIEHEKLDLHPLFCIVELEHPLGHCLLNCICEQL